MNLKLRQPGYLPTIVFYIVGLLMRLVEILISSLISMADL